MLDKLLKRREKIPLPARVHLGQRTTVWVKVISPEALAKVYHGEKSATADRTVAGCWDIEKGTIWISSDLTPRQKWDTYWHELQHAVHDLGLNWKGGI